MLMLQAAKGPTGRLLKEMLAERGLLSGRAKGVVNYGYGEAHNLPTLNANAGHQNKYQELVALDEGGVRTVPFSHSAADLDPPMFGRKFHHTQGRDIFVYQVKPLLRGDRLSDYYTQVVPKLREFRVWSFRGKHLATYQKVLTYPNKNGRRGRNKEVWNWGNGYAYNFVRPEEVPGALKDLGARAVEALDLDFGATDIIQSGRLFYVLEVNTAPGTQGAARQGMTSLVNSIERWVKTGFPERD